jgi:glycogen synthase
LQQRLGLKKADLPLVGIITRLTHQKGIHLIKHAIWRTLERGGQVLFYPISCFSNSFLLWIIYQPIGLLFNNIYLCQLFPNH